jgi:hypothetical protein
MENREPIDVPYTSIEMYSGDVYSVSNCHNVEKHNEFYLEYLRFNVTCTGNVGCF